MCCKQIDALIAVTGSTLEAAPARVQQARRPTTVKTAMPFCEARACPLPPRFGASASLGFGCGSRQRHTAPLGTILLASFDEAWILCAAREQEAIDRFDCVGAFSLRRDVLLRRPLGPGHAPCVRAAVQHVLDIGVARADASPDGHRLPHREEAMSPGTVALSIIFGIVAIGSVSYTHLGKEIGV